MNKPDDIKLKIAEGKLKEAIQGFMAAARQADTETYNSAVLLSLSFHHLESSQANGLISFKKASQGLNQIANRLLKMVDAMKADGMEVVN
jgi:hypothetical protein